MHKQDLGYTVRIYLDPIFASVKHKAIGNKHKHMAWTINEHTHLPAEEQTSLIKQLSCSRRKYSFISISIFIQKQAVQFDKYKLRKKKEPGGSG